MLRRGAVLIYSIKSKNMFSKQPISHRSTLFSAASIAAFATLALLGCQGTDSSLSPPSGVELWPATSSPSIYSDADHQFVDELIAKMSVEEKVGQILQAEIQTITPEQAQAYHIGSILNGGGSLPDRNSNATARDWAEFADRYYRASMDTSDGFNAIPIFWGTDAVHGHNNLKGATIFPHNIGLGATRNSALIEKIGEITALEVRASGIEWVFAPTVAVARNDRWGRTFESYAEDPQLVAELAEHMVIGLQGKVNSSDFLDEYHVAATAKHFLADGGTTDGDDQGNAQLLEAELVTIHNPGYVSAIEAGVQSVMASFSAWNGTKMHGNEYLLSTVLKKRMGFEGLVVGDWNGHGQVPHCTNISCPQSINAGIDHVMVPYDWQKMYPLTLQQVKNGEISFSRLDEAVKRILLVKKKLGLFNNKIPSQRAVGGKQSLVGSAQHRAIARQAVRESLVLLKNNHATLPITPGQHILVTGPGADNIAMQSGGWSVTWQGTGTSNADFPAATSIYQGLANAAELQGSSIELSSDGNFVEKPDVAIVVFGESPYAEGQGDINTLEFEPGSKTSLKMLQALQQQGIKTVSVFLSGRPLWVSPELNASDAFVAAWLPGTEAQGIADVILSDQHGQPRYDFSGKLAFSWPQTPLQFELNVGDTDYNPLFAYGFGLTYQSNQTLDVLNTDVAGVQHDKNADLPLYHGRPLQPWHVVLDNAGQNQLLSGSFARLMDGSVTVTTSDKDIQEDALTVTFKNAWGGKVYLDHGAPFNLTSYIENGVLAFDFKAENMNKTGLQISLSCGDQCSNLVDLWPFAKDHQGEGWQHLAIPLKCFASDDADFTVVQKPFLLNFYGSGAFSFANISLKQQGEGNFNCPDQNSLTTTPAPLRAFWADDWWMQRHQQKLADKALAQYEWVMIGDSITHGWEDAGDAVWQQHFADIKTLNLGFGGDRTENVLWHIEHGAVDGLAPRLVTLMIGTNNTGHRLDSPESIRDGIAAIIDQLQRKLPDSQIVLMAIFPRGADSNDVERRNNQQTNKLLVQLAAEKAIEFAEFNKAFLTPDNTLSKDIMPDLLHPNETGYEIWAKQLTPYVDQYIRDNHAH